MNWQNILYLFLGAFIANLFSEKRTLSDAKRIVYGKIIGHSRSVYQNPTTDSLSKFNEMIGEAILISKDLLVKKLRLLADLITEYSLANFKRTLERQAEEIFFTEYKNMIFEIEKEMRHEIGIDD